MTVTNSAHAQAAPPAVAAPAPVEAVPAAAEPVPAPVEAAPAAVAAPGPAPAPAPASAAMAAEAPPAAAKPKPPPYSLPWQLRPVAPGNVIRLDTAFSFYKNPTSGNTGAAQATSLLGSYKIIPNLALIARVGLVHNSPPDAVTPPLNSATSILNPVLGGLYGIKLSKDFKLGLFLGFTLPVGSGGGTNPNKDKAAANQVGIATRSSMDNAMFAVNYLTIFPGVDFAFVRGGFTAQVEATIFQLTKTRGPESADKSNTNFTAGLHVGYFVLPMLSLGGEIRHQRWLSTPSSVKADPTHASRDTTTFAVGPRFHFKFSESVWFRPGIALALPIDDPMKKNDYKIAQLDLPLSF